ncbi:hypothetical protein AgCh_022205 [Apium graveolens]
MFSCSISEGHPEAIDVESLIKELLDTNKCYLLNSGLEIYVGIGKNTSLDERKSASRAVETPQEPSVQTTDVGLSPSPDRSNLDDTTVSTENHHSTALATIDDPLLVSSLKSILMCCLFLHFHHFHLRNHLQALETRVNLPLKSSEAPVAPTCQSNQAFLKASVSTYLFVYIARQC